jgi:hypothetical protein
MVTERTERVQESLLACTSAVEDINRQVVNRHGHGTHLLKENACMVNCKGAFDISG